MPGRPPAPTLSLVALDGAAFDLSAYPGRVVLVNFWASWCPPCVAEMPSLARLHRRLAGSGLEVVAVNAGESPEDIQSFIDRLEPDLPVVVLLDPVGEAFNTWGARALPQTFVVDKGGRLVYFAEGARDMDAAPVRGLLRRLLEER